MIFPVQDAFWTDTTTFIRKTIGPDTPFIGPREFRAVLPKVFPYDWVHAIEILSQFGGVAVHKGLMHELPVPLLQAMGKEWRCVFANEVFLFFMPPNSTLPPTPELHLQFFYDRLQSMEKLAQMQQPRTKALTAFVVVASRTSSFLEKTLESLSPFHMPVLVVAATADAARREAYRSICSAHRAEMHAWDKNAAPAKALRLGVWQLLKDAHLAWICSLDDTMVARPDFLLVMEKFRNRETRPLLGGLWTEADGTSASISRDGFQLITLSRQVHLHRYGHRDYWAVTSRSFFNWKNLPLLSQKPEMLVIRDLVSLQTFT